MRQLTADHLTGLRAAHEPPCISLYQPTHRKHPENQQDPIRYRNTLTEMESSLRQKFGTQEVDQLLEKFQALARDDYFWNNRTDGLAIFSSSDTFEVFDLQRRVPELLVAADSFHLKPVLRILQTADRYQILALNRHEAKLYEGDRDALDPVELTGFPSTITGALGEELTEPYLSVGRYGAGAARAGSRGLAGAGPVPSIHGQRSKKDEVDIDRDRFFRLIDRGILEHHSRPSGLPLMLAALTEYHEPFHAVSHNPFLMTTGITKNPESLSLDELRVEAWRIIEPLCQQRLAKLNDDFELARSRDLGSDDLAQVSEAARAGRVETLLVEEDRQIPGNLDSTTGGIRSGDISNPEIDDVLDDLAELVLRRKGNVVVVPPGRMPTAEGLAATYRY